MWPDHPYHELFDEWVFCWIRDPSEIERTCDDEGYLLPVDSPKAKGCVEGSLQPLVIILLWVLMIMIVIVIMPVVSTHRGIRGFSRPQRSRLGDQGGGSIEKQIKIGDEHHKALPQVLWVFLTQDRRQRDKGDVGISKVSCEKLVININIKINDGACSTIKITKILSYFPSARKSQFQFIYCSIDDKYFHLFFGLLLY